MTWRCDWCGKFMAYDDPDASSEFIPDSAYSYEEIVHRCGPCTRNQGRACSLQSFVAPRM
jgi:hypothetical protein